MKRSFRNEVLQQLEEVRSDTRKPHKFEFYLYFPTLAAARQAAHKIEESEFQTEITPGATGANWLCLVSISITPEIAPLDEVGGFFEQVAAALGGDFAGWQADVVD